MDSECVCNMHCDEPYEEIVEEILTCFVAGVTCCECDEPIPHGTQYERAKGLDGYSGDWNTHNTCIPCLRIRNSFCPYEWVYATLRAHLRGCLGFDYVTGEWEDWAAELDALDGGEGGGDDSEM